MPQIKLKYSKEISDDFDRILSFYNKIDNKLSERVGRLIANSINSLKENPEIASPSKYNNDIRMLVIPFGNSAFKTYYKYDKPNKLITIGRIYHSREIIRLIELEEDN